MTCQRPSNHRTGCPAEGSSASEFVSDGAQVTSGGGRDGIVQRQADTRVISPGGAKQALAFARSLLASLFLITGVAQATAQAAPMALDTFGAICQADANQSQTAAQFEADGWTAPPAALLPAFAHELMEPDEEALFVRDAGTGKILAATMTEKRGLLGTRTRSACFLRVFVETPDQMRADFRNRMEVEPDTITDNAKVHADLWTTLLKGRTVGFRAEKLPEGFWMVTVSRVLVNA